MRCPQSLAINAKTANALNLTLLLRADKVIEQDAERPIAAELVGASIQCPLCRSRNVVYGSRVTVGRWEKRALRAVEGSMPSEPRSASVPKPLLRPWCG
jgi:transposase-like protein